MNSYRGKEKMPRMLYADVIVDISIENLDRTYQYKIPPEMETKVKVGTPVVIPFGKGNRKINGYVVGVSEKPKYDKSRLKNIEDVPDKAISATQVLISLACWMKEYYGSTMNDAIKTTMPVRRKIKEMTRKRVVLKADDESAKELYVNLCGKKNAAARVRLLRELIKTKQLDYEYVRKNLNISNATLNSLLEKGIIDIESTRLYRTPFTDAGLPDKEIALNVEQKKAVEAITAGYYTHTYKPFLLHGVTGSGKTEVYMSVIEKVIADNRQVIMLIPEIALTYQTMQRVYRRFKDRVSILNSKMSAGERYDQYERIRKGETDIVIGPRSALFVPFDKIGLIIIDEEHEDSYKSEMPPKYHAREVAEQLARLHNAVLLMGSATPSVDTYYRTRPDYPGEDKITRYELTERTGSAFLPDVKIIDMREEIKKKNYSMLSVPLYNKILERLDRKEQVMLFINRRGYTGFVSCRNCGESIKCPNCDISLTIHHTKNKDKMVCHLCGYETDTVVRCPKCSSSYIGGFGVGTQKVEEMVRNTFPQAKVLRMDADTTSGKGGHEKILTAFANREADILIGTQMIVKGHDFPCVTLVGILAADMTLHISDFRASEKTFELLVQAAGRAGRGSLKGEVIVQTYKPEHYAIVCAEAQDYKAFYEQEIAYRKIMKYPPVSNMMTLFISSDSEKLSADIMNVSFNTANDIIRTRKDTVLIGPAPHPVFKANNMYRYLLHIKSNNIIILKGVRRAVENAVKKGFSGYKYVMQFDMQ